MVFRIKDIQPGLGSSNPRYFMPLAGQVFFAADADGTGPELWISDGTEAATRLVADLCPPGFGGSNPGQSGRAVLGGLYFFVAYNGSSSFLFHSDGVATTLADAITTNPSNLVVAGGQLFYYGATNLWRWDAVAGLPVRMTDSFGNGFNPFNMMTVGAELFFTHGNDLWRTNGGTPTRVGTPAVTPLGIPYTLGTAGSMLFIGGTVPTGGFGLWAYTSPAPLPLFLRAFASVPGVQTGGLSQFPRMVGLGSTLLFAANDGISGEELWRSDGTAVGTFLLSDINISSPGSSSYPDQLTFAGPSLVFFVANDGTHGRELWRTDGTAAGTRRLTDINVGGDSNPKDLTVAGSKLYFTATPDGWPAGRQLFVLDLLTETTRQLTRKRMWGDRTDFYVFETSEHNTPVLMTAGETLFFTAIRPFVASDTVHDASELWGLDLREAHRPAPVGITVINTTAGPTPSVSLLLTFSEPIIAGPATISSLTITVGGVVRAVTSVASGPIPTQLSVNLSGLPLASGNIPVSVAYTAPASPLGGITDGALNPLATFTLNAETFSNDANVTTLHATYQNLILTGAASVGNANLNSNRITVDQPIAVQNVFRGNAGVDHMDGGEGGDLYVVSTATDHSAAEIHDSGVAGVDELRFSTAVAGDILSVFGGDQGLEIVSIATGSVPGSPIRTGVVSAHIDASLAPNSLQILGNNGANSLRGTSFADWIDGGGGIDSMNGGVGSDVYLINRGSEHGANEINDSGPSIADNDELRFTSTSAGDAITVYSGDTGLNSVVLWANRNAPAGAGDGSLETTPLNVNASAAIGALRIMGNGGRNIITGTQNMDTIIGFGGDDLFVIPQASHHPFGILGEEVIEGGAGSDEIRFSDTFPGHAGATLLLSPGVVGIERVTIGGGTGLTPTSTSLDLNLNAQHITSNLTLIGNLGANRIRGSQAPDIIRGNQGNDTLIGGLGQDDLQGGPGRDCFMFDTPVGDPLTAVSNRDRINDFAVGLDRIVLDSTSYPDIPLGPLNATSFVLGAAATSIHQRIIYDRPSGFLYYDRDGSAAVYSPCQIAVFDPVGGFRPALTAAHIQVV